MKFFSVDGPLYRFFARLWDVIVLNFLWLVFSLPVVTFGASTIAAYDICLRMVDEREGYIWKGFWKAFKANLKRGIPLGLIFLLALYALYLDLQILGAATARWGLFLAVFLVTAFLFFLAFVYAFALQARYENGILQTVRNSYRIAIRYFPRTLALAGVLAAECALFFWNTVLEIVFAFIGPVCLMLTISGFALYCFRQIEREPGAVSNPEQLEENIEK